VEEMTLASDDELICHLMREIVKALVDYADEVEVGLVHDSTTVTLTLKVASADVGKVIGKQGRTARSIRTILAAASMKLHKRYALDIREEATTDRRGLPGDS
jgi:predicted RNA-binding protein YlqC (UPF0109 family)